MEKVAAEYKFDWVEYTVVAVMLLLSNLIGAYYTFYKKQKTFKDYMLGGKNMGVFPVAMSLVASFVSGITLLGIPTEVYLYGTQYAISTIISGGAVMVVSGIFYLPVFYKLQLNSVFEYLELRFSHNVRIVGTFLYSLSLVCFLPAVIFVPALAFNQVTDVPVRVITPIITASCLFYTAFGGLKAVLWTDALQNVFTFLAMVFVVILGCAKLGGLQEIWNINEEGHRLELLNFDPNPFARNTFWTVTIGSLFIYLTNIGVNPGSVQRFLSVPSLGAARKVLFVSAIGFYAICALSYLMGMVLYARYHNCDPVASGEIKNHGQMVPMYIMEIGRDYPGLPGLFLCGVLSAALSTISAWLNTVGGTLYKDIKEVFLPNVQHSEAKQSAIIKSIVITLGVVCALGVLVVEKMGTILQMAVSLMGIVYGSILALFTLGIFFPRVNSKGAIAGTVASLLCSGWIMVKAQYYIMEGKLGFPGKVTRIDDCPAYVKEHFISRPELLFNYTGVGSPVAADSSVPLLYQLSYFYYVIIGMLSGIIIGLAVSLLTELPDLSTINPDLFSSYVQGFLPNSLNQKPRPNKEEYTLSSQIDCKNEVIKTLQ